MLLIRNSFGLPKRISLSFRTEFFWASERNYSSLLLLNGILLGFRTESLYALKWIDFLASEKNYFKLSIENQTGLSNRILWASERNIFWFPNRLLYFRSEILLGFIKKIWASERNHFGLLIEILLGTRPESFWLFEWNNVLLLPGSRKKFFRASVWRSFGLLNGSISHFWIEFFWSSKLNHFWPPYGIILGFWMESHILGSWKKPFGHSNQIRLGFGKLLFWASERNNF